MTEVVAEILCGSDTHVLALEDAEVEFDDAAETEE